MLVGVHVLCCCLVCHLLVSYFLQDLVCCSKLQALAPLANVVLCYSLCAALTAFNLFNELLQISVYGLLVMMFVGTVFIKMPVLVSGHSIMAIAESQGFPFQLISHE